MEQKIRTYESIIGDIQQTLLKSGRMKNGFNRQTEVFKLLQELKEHFGISLSIAFLRNLLGNDRRASYKVRNLLVGKERKKVLKYSKNLSFSKAKKDILTYAYYKGLKYHTTYEGKAVLSYNVFIADSRTAEIGKEGLRRTQKVFKFIE